MSSDSNFVEQTCSAVGVERTNVITPEQDRFNGRLYLYSYMLIYLSGPVDYVGVVQASLCDKLGTSHAVANLPTATYSLGYLLPFLLSSVIPYRLERSVVVVANLITATSMGIVCTAMFLPFSNSVRIGAVIFQGVVMGLAACSSDVYMLQCLGRGTTETGRARAFKYTFSLGPIMGVVGSLGTQFILNGGIPRLTFPYDFGLVYLICVPCLAGVAFLSSRYKMVGLQETERPPLVQSAIENFKAFVADRNLVLLWFAFFCWYIALSAAPNLSLYAIDAVKRSPASLAGLSMALRFAGKSVGGFLLGIIATRFGAFAPCMATIAVGGASLAWAWITPGYVYLVSFMLIGAGELGGGYIPNSVLSLTSPERGARNMALLALAAPATSFAPLVYGAMADAWGFHASFGFGIASALVGLWLMSRVTRRGSATRQKEAAG